MPEVRKERSHWRDPSLCKFHPELGLYSGDDRSISARHRTWSYDVPMVDLDFILVLGEDTTNQNGGFTVLEFGDGKPRAIIEYKCGDDAKPTSERPKKLAALKSLANASDIPFCDVFYQPDFSQFRVVCYTNPTLNQIFSEPDYVKFLLSF